MDSIQTIQTDIIKNDTKEETSKLSSLSDSLSIKNESAPNSVQSNTNQSTNPDDLNSANLSNQSLTNQSNQSQNNSLSAQQMTNNNLTNNLTNNLNNSDDLLKGVDTSSDFNTSSNGLIKNDFGKLPDLPDVKNESSSPNSSILTGNINKLSKTNSTNNVPNNGNMSMPCNNLNSAASMNSSSMNIINGPILINNSTTVPTNQTTNSTSLTTSNLNPINSNNLTNMNCKMSAQQPSQPQPPPPNNGLNHPSNLNSNMMNNNPMSNPMNNQMNNLLNNPMSNQMNNQINNQINNQMNNMTSMSTMSNNMSNSMTNMTNSMSNMNNSLSSNLNPIKNSNSQPYIQQASNQIYIFSTSLANEAAEAVLRKEVDSIVSYHAGLEKTQKYVEEHLHKAHLPNWQSNSTNKRNKQSPCSINSSMNGQSTNQPQQTMSPYGSYRPPSNSSVVSNASYRLGPSPGLQNEMTNWNTGTPNDQISNSNLSGWQSPQQNQTNNFMNSSLRTSMNSNSGLMMSNGSDPNLIREKKLEKVKQIRDRLLPHDDQNFNFLNDDGMQRNWPQPDQLNDQPNGPFIEDNCMMPNQQIPPQQPINQQPTGRRRKANQANQSHVSPISQNSSTLNSPNPNIAPSPNQRQNTNPPPYSPATSSVNSMRLPPYASPGPSTPSSMDGTVMLKNNSPKSMQHLNQQLNMNSNLDQQLNAPQSPATKKCKNTLDNLDNSVGSDCFNPMNSSLPNNSSNKQAICKLNSLSDPQLMPVPSPQKIQYLQGFEGQELTIQKQPNTSLPDSELSSSELDFMNNLDYMSNPISTPHQPNQLPMQSNQLQNPNLGPMSNQGPPPQFMNNGPPNRMSCVNSPFGNGPPPHLQAQQQQMSSQLINQPQPNQMMIGLDNSSNNSNQFDPRMQPHPSFCSPGPPPQLSQAPNPMNNPNIPNNRFDMYGPNHPNNRMQPQQQFKPNQLIGGPLITNPNDFNTPLNEPPMGSNHLQNLQKMAHTFDDGPSKLDSSNSSLSSSQFNDANLMNNSNNNPMMIRSNSGNPMINNSNDPMSCIGNPQQMQQGRLPPVGNYSQSMNNPPNQFNSMNPNSMPSDPSYQQMQSMPGNYGKMQNYNQQPPMSNVPSGQTPVGFKSAPGPNQGHPMSGAPSPIPNQGPPQRNLPMNYNGGFNPNMNPNKMGPNAGPPMQSVPTRMAMNNPINVQMNNAKPSTIGYIPANRPINPTGVQPQRPPNLEFLNRYTVNNQGPIQQFQPNNNGLPMNSNDLNQIPGRMNSNMPPMIQPRGPPNQQLMTSDTNNPMISNQPMYRQQNGPVSVDGGLMHHHSGPMNGNQMSPNFNPSNQMSSQSFNPNNPNNSMPPMSGQSNSAPGNYPPPMMSKPQFYQSLNEAPPPNNYDNPAAYQNFPRQMYATNQTGGN